MTAGDIHSFYYKQRDLPKATGATLAAGTFATVNAADPRAYVTAGAGETDPCVVVIPKNITGEAIGQSPPDMLTYASAETKFSGLLEGIVSVIVQTGITLFRDDKVKVGTSGHAARYVDGTDADFRLVKGKVIDAKVVGNGVLTAKIQIGVNN